MLALLALSVSGILLFVYWFTEIRPRPTVTGWRASVTTFAGDGSSGLRDDVLMDQAQFADPVGVVVDRVGNVYISDAGENNRIRRITLDGKITTFAGGRAEGWADGIGPAAAFHTPSGLGIDGEGNLYVADTGNNRIRKIEPDAQVTTLAGDGTAGFRDGPAANAQFNGPIGLAVDRDGNVYVADTYNDRIRQITPDGQVKTLAGGESPGYADGPALQSLFDTPCGITVAADGELLIADTGNDRLRKLTKDGQVITLQIKSAESGGDDGLDGPIGLALTHDNFIYVAERDRGRIRQIAPDGTAHLIAGMGSGFADGDGPTRSRFNGPSGIAVDTEGALYVADAANYIVRKLSPVENKSNGPSAGKSVDAILPRLTPDVVESNKMLWPLEPQDAWHEVVATIGEVRGSYDGESRHHLHAGIDIQGPYGARVRAVRDEKVSSPLSNWEFDGLNEGISVGLMTYVHLRVGRDEKNEPIDAQQFIALRDEQGKVNRVRIKRGARFRVGDVIGTVNRMYHVHLNFGPWGAEANPLMLPFIGFSDSVSPKIERDGIQLFTPDGQRITEKRNGRLLVRGNVKIIVNAYDQADGNQARRRLGLYKLGYQILKADGGPAAPGFEQPRITIEFNRLPPEREAVKIAYADSSGITVYGSAATKFLYVVTNTVRDAKASEGIWPASELPPGDYTLRIIAADYARNEALEGRDLAVTIE